MSGKTNISWTEATWNPVTGCTQVSPGCAHCYAKALTERFGGDFSRVILHPERLDAPLHWRKPRRVFVNSMSDLFHEQVPDAFIAAVFGIMAASPQHTFQILTKRPDRMRAWFQWNAGGQLEPAASRPGKNCALAVARIFREGFGAYPSLVSLAVESCPWPLPNVWLGTSVENQRWADVRLPILLDTPAAVRFVSCEPLLGKLTLLDHLYKNLRPTGDFRTKQGVRQMKYAHDGRSGLGWVIVGGESGPRRRPMRQEWLASIVAQCEAAGMACWVKQDSALRPGQQGDIPDELWAVREWPA